MWTKILLGIILLLGFLNAQAQNVKLYNPRIYASTHNLPTDSLQQLSLLETQAETTLQGISLHALDSAAWYWLQSLSADVHWGPCPQKQTCLCLGLQAQPPCLRLLPLPSQHYVAWQQQQVDNLITHSHELHKLPTDFRQLIPAYAALGLGLALGLWFWHRKYRRHAP